MSAPTKHRSRTQPATPVVATRAENLTAEEKRILAAYRSVPLSGNNRETILLVVERYAELCPYDKRPALHLVRGGRE